MAYFISQAGAGAADGSDADNPVSLALADWSAVGGDTAYFLGTFTSRIQPTAGANGSASARTVLRGDWPGNPYADNIAANYAIHGNGRVYMDITGFSFTSLTSDLASVLLTSVNANCRIYRNNFSGRTGMWFNGADNNQVYDNVINRNAAYAGYGIRLFNAAASNMIFRNTFTSSDPDLGNFGTGISLADANTTTNMVFGNKVFGIDGDGINCSGSADGNYIWGNKIGPIVKDALALESSFSNYVCNNFVHQDKYHGTTYPGLKLGDAFGAGTPSNNNIIRNNLIYVPTAGGAIATLGGASNPMGASNTITNNHFWRTGTTSATTEQYYVNDGVINAAQSHDTLQSNGYNANGFHEDFLLLNAYEAQRTSSAIGNGYPWWESLGFINPEGMDGEPFSTYDTDIGCVQTVYGPFHPRNT